MSGVPQKARAVIVGGGAIGASIAYHLCKINVNDVALLERKELTCGTTWHAAGLVAQLRATESMTKLSQYSAALYQRLREETGEDTGYRQNGAINVADSDGLMTEYRRLASVAKRVGLPAEILSPKGIAARCPQINLDGLLGGIWLPADGQIDPVGLTRALAKGARAGGAAIFENVAVERVIVEKGRVVGVATTAGDIAADIVVLAAGMWTRRLAADIGVAVPLHACEHYYIVTEPIDGLPADMPAIRDVGARAYYKEDAGKLLLGGFEKTAKPWGENGIPDGFSFESLPGDFDGQFMPIMEKAMRRVPLLETAGVRLFFCGPESFTPDNRYHIGPAPEIRGLWVAAGMNSIGVQSAGGVGRAMAQWIKDGVPPSDLGAFDVARAMPFQRNRRYLRERATESMGTLYDVHWPYRQMETARDARRGPLREDLAAAGACFGEAAGWERPNWFAPGESSPKYEYAYGRQNWFAYCRQECQAAQNAAAIVDLSSFAKYRALGTDACRLLNRVCANDVDVPVGCIVYTAWLNERGGFEADLTVTRLAENDFLILSGVASQTRDIAWLNRWRRQSEHAEIVDMTSAYANIGLFGPNAAAILRAAGAEGVSDDGFPYATMKTVEVGFALAHAMRLGYAGEAGFELLIPTEFAVNVYRALMAEGAALGLRNVGLHAVDSMRMEKARRHFGDDLTTEDSPTEAGLSFAVAPDKPGGFVGRDAFLASRSAPRSKRLAHFMLTAGVDAPLMFGEEPVLRDGVIVGGVTSAAYGHRVNASLALAYVRHDGGADNAWHESGDWEIEIAGERHAATWLKRPPYDPDNAALKLDIAAKGGEKS